MTYQESNREYDLIVIGSGPAGQKGAVAAAKLGKRVAIIERDRKCVGGVCLHTGTVPSKTMREAILYLTGFRQREVFTEKNAKKREVTMDQLRLKLDEVVQRERAVILDQLERNGIDSFHGEAKFLDANTISIDHLDGGIERITAKKILLASGTKPSRPDNVPFDGRQVFDSDEILKIESVPRSMTVIGGGVIGIEYGIMFAALGVKVTIVDGRSRLLSFCDQEVIDHLMYCARAMGITFRLGESVESVRCLDQNRVVVELESKKCLVAETAFFSVGREGDTDSLDVEAAGISVDKRKRIKCNEKFQTNIPNIFAVGDVIGFPSLASTSMEQGRQAISSMYDLPFEPTKYIPYGLFTIPEIAMVGQTEQELTELKVPYEIGISKFDELVKSQICGAKDGLLKLLFHRETKMLLGVHSIGYCSTEIIHIGMMVMSFEQTIDCLAHGVFNHPTMAESFKVAALDGLNRLSMQSPSMDASMRGVEEIEQDLNTAEDAAATLVVGPSGFIAEMAQSPVQ